MKSDFFESWVIDTLGQCELKCLITSAGGTVDRGDNTSFSGLGPANAFDPAAIHAIESSAAPRRIFLIVEPPLQRPPRV
jgi:hypothetical protein